MHKKHIPSLHDVQAEIVYVANQLGVDPRDLTRDKFLANTDRIKRSDIDRYGPYSSIKEEILNGPKDLAEARGLELRLNSKRRKERQIGEAAYLMEAAAASLKEAITSLDISLSKKPQALITPSKSKQSAVAFISDNHFGINVTKRETGITEYNWKVAARRLGKYIHEVCERVPLEDRESTELWIALGGDHTQGILHRLKEDDIDDMTTQLKGAIQIFTSLIDFARTQFGKIVVPFTPGNHMRFTFKGGGRALNQKFDGFHTIMAEWLSSIFRNCDDVEFIIPKTPFTIFKILGNTYYMTHGDSTFNLKSSPRSAIRINQITAAANSIARSKVCGGKLDVVMLGHFHRPTRVTLEHGAELIINGTSSGLDPFALNALGDHYTDPAQTFWIVREKEPIRAFDVIRLADADSKAKYNEIIPTPVLH